MASSFTRLVRKSFLEANKQPEMWKMTHFKKIGSRVGPGHVNALPRPRP